MSYKYLQSCLQNIEMRQEQYSLVSVATYVVVGAIEPWCYGAVVLYEYVIL